jgi:hypothetical protein
MVLGVVPGMILNDRIGLEAVSIGLNDPVWVLKKVGKSYGTKQQCQQNYGQAAGYIGAVHANQ